MISTNDLITFLENPGKWLAMKQAELGFTGKDMDNNQYFSQIKTGSRAGTFKNFLQIVKKIQQIEKKI